MEITKKCGVRLGAEDTWNEKDRTPLEVEFLRALYAVVENRLDLTYYETREGLPTMKVRITFTSPCEVDSIEIKIYKAQRGSIGKDLEYHMKKHYSELRVLSVDAL